MNKLLLEDKVIVVIGASQGLGKVFAESFAAEGASVVMTARKEAVLKEAAKDVEKVAVKGRVLPIAADYASREDAKRVFETAIKEFGKVDCLVTSATHPCKATSLEAQDDEYIDGVIDTDVKGLLFYNREALKHFLERQSGSIINIGSNNVGRPICDSTYCAAKYACLGLTKQIAIRCVGTHVRANLLNPGSFQSVSSVALKDIGHMYDDQEKVQASGIIPVIDGSMTNIMKARTNRAVPVNLQQVANAAVFLASDLAKDITGQVLTVDRGGYM